MSESKIREAREVQIKAEGFISGMQATALCLQKVLQRKADIGIITKDTAMAIFGAVGDELDDAIDRAFPAPREVVAGAKEQ